MDIESFLRSFVRAWGWGLGRQAARRTGWLLVPLLVVLVVLGWLGWLPAPLAELLPLVAGGWFTL